MNLQDLPSYEEMQKNVSLVLANSHFSDGLIRPTVPAYVEIGGIHINSGHTPLDQELEYFLGNSSKHGAIFFSMGSNFQVSSLDPKVIRVFYNVLSKVKQNVVWKWDGLSEVPGTSKNIFYGSWLPQGDILAHKNLKLFVTHGGKGSIVESQYHGVPMIGLPAFFDQLSNVQSIVDDGYGLQLDYQTMTEDDFRKTIEEVLQNRTYADNVKRFSNIYRDRPLSARDTVVFWVEYVLRHHGAPHIQSSAVHLNLFVLYGFDVIGFVVLVVFVCLKIAKMCFRRTFRKPKLTET